MADERRNGHTTEKRLVQNRQRASGRSGRRASEQWRKRQQRYRVISWILTAVFMVIFYALICACVGNRKLYKKTTINGLDVGGMKSAEAAKSINDQFRRYRMTHTASGEEAMGFWNPGHLEAAMTFIHI